MGPRVDVWFYVSYHGPEHRITVVLDIFVGGVTL